MSELELRNKAEIEAIELTEDEMKAAIQEAKIKKWYHIKNNPYWLKKEFGNKVGRAVWVVLLLVYSSFFNINAQPKDPSSDPDLIGVNVPSDPSGDPDEILNEFPKELVCDSVAIIDQSGKRYLVVFYKQKRIAVYRKEKKSKLNQRTSSGYSFY